MLLANDEDDNNDDEDMKHLSLRGVSMAAFSCCVLLLLSLAASVGGAKGGPCREAGGPDDDDDDIGAKTIGATVVFDGEATVALPDQTHRGTVQFRVHQTLKGSGVKRSEIVSVGNFSEPGANLSIGSRYLVFADGPFDLHGHINGTSTGAGNSTWRFYRLSSFPEVVSKKAVKEVRNHACAKCGEQKRLPYLSSGIVKILKARNFG